MKNLKPGLVEHFASMVNVRYVGEDMAEVGLPLWMSDGDGVAVYVTDNKDGSYSLSDAGDTLAVHIGKYVMNPPKGEDRERLVTEVKTAGIKLTDDNVFVMDVKQDRDLPDCIYHFGHVMAELTYVR